MGDLLFPRVHILDAFPTRHTLTLKSSPPVAITWKNVRFYLSIQFCGKLYLVGQRAKSETIYNGVVCHEFINFIHREEAHDNYSTIINPKRQ
jgi:hypothetical protein